MLQKILFLNIFLFLVCDLSAQKPPENDSEFEKTYNRRITKDVLYGVYIPRDLTDAFIQLNRLIDDESKAKFKAMSEDSLSKQLYFSFGRWMIHNWGFYGGSRLSHYIKSMGIHQPEEMARFIMVAYHRNLNRKPLEIRALLKSFHDKREAEKEEWIQNSIILHKEIKARPRPPQDTVIRN